MNICLLVFLGGLTNDLFAQSDSTILHPKFSISVPDSGTFLTDSAALVEKNLSTIGDSLVSAADSVLRDSVAKDSSARKSDSLAAASGVIPLSPSALTSVVHYTAEDSIAIDLGTRKAQLYNKGVIDYDGMQLKADDIRVDFDQQMLTAQLVLDTSGQPLGRPYFKEKDAEYMADTIFFNYRTKKGLISGVITKQGDGFLHGSKVKKVNDSIMYLNSGQYTTCNYSHPHFAINSSHSKLIMHDKILTGPAYVTIEDVPTPLVLPFAFFPMKQDRTSGLIMPSYGWMNNRGYYLKDGGYYFAMSDFFDLKVLLELYEALPDEGLEILDFPCNQFGEQAPGDDEEILKGDINADGVITSADLVALGNWLVGRESGIVDWEAGDFDESGSLDVFDLMLMRNYLLEKTV